ncbi:murein hydrolase activator EnvC family protein [Proteiniphilum sp. UBA1028]|jgi:septal ring factor EnvC (AmiA/AmiB activator)|uniref:murein hydrolase activator EnvC family protein n=1 Tax=Proteiniphilum sp. UBA1028 TaxID=1947251 RepID=UPI0025E589BF|nr:peptidoglycan DD-metalloendopeptidase family protein [Proteiniphilum sp. UBA1028]
MRRLFVIFHFFAAVFLSFSQNPQIERLQKQQQVLQEEIKNTNKLYLNVKKQTTTILDRINLINKQIAARKELIDAQQAEIRALQQEESRLEAEITRLNKELKKKQDNYANAVQGMLKHNVNQNKLFFILSGKSLGESLRRMQYLREYSKWQKSQGEEIKRQNAAIAIRKEELAKARDDKEKALLAIQSEQQRLRNEEKTKQSEMTAVRGQQQQLQKALKEKQQQANQLNAQIEKLIAEEVARQEREAEARRLAAEAERRRKADELAAKSPRETGSSKTNKETTSSSAEKESSRVTSAAPRIEADKSTASSETFKLSNNFASNKGKLPMPVTGTASIVGNFGAKKHNEWNVTTNSNGIDIQAQKGASIRSVFDGEVSKVFSFPGSNTCVIVRHGEYYTFYANIYDLFVKQGDKVKTGQSLGRIFTDPDTNISAMHFQLWQKTTKLNPAPWLSR